MFYNFSKNREHSMNLRCQPKRYKICIVLYHKCIINSSLTLVLLNMAGLGQIEFLQNLVCLIIIQTHQYNEMVMMNHNQECGHER